jgi:phosphoribosylanthranilate isomerase
VTSNTHPIHIKICGITNIEDARVAIEAGADLLGFILYPQSPRYITPEKMHEIIRELRDQPPISPNLPKSPPSPKISNFPALVGVFVHEPITRIQAILDQTGLDYAQLHSDETPETLAQLQGRAFKALRPTDEATALVEAARYAGLGPSGGPALMIDAYDPHAYGGTGKQADWRAAAAVVRRHRGLLLAGGLTPANVAEAIRTVRPWGVDVGSGVEAAPGRKDHEKVRAFIGRAKAAGSE